MWVETMARGSKGLTLHANYTSITNIQLTAPKLHYRY